MKTQRISKRQALLIAITTVMTTVFQPVFRNFLLWSGNSAWIPILLATGFSLLIIQVVLRLAARFPKQSVTEYLPLVWGKIIGYALAAVLLVGFLLKGSIILRNVSEFFVTAILPETPISAVLITMLVLVGAAILVQLEGIVRFNEIVLPVILTSFMLVLIGSLPQLNGWNLLPLFDKGYRGLFPSFELASSFLLNSTFILFLYPLIVDTDGIAKEACKTLMIAGGVMLTIFVNVVLFLGPRLGQALTWPYLAVIENVHIGVERGEAIFMMIWMLAAFVTISLFVYVFALGVIQVAPVLKIQWVGMAALLVAAYISLTPNNLPSALVDHAMLNKYFLYLQVTIPILTLGLATLRKLGGDRT
jgi:spore germination protein KB